MFRWMSLMGLVVLLTAAVAVLFWSAPADVRPPVLTPESDPNAYKEVPSQDEGPPPRFVLEGAAAYDFGALPQKTKGSHTWQIRNEGVGDLNVWLWETSCSCTVATLKREGAAREGGSSKTITVPPGGEHPIEVSWDTREWRKFVQSATLGTNDPDMPRFTLVVRGDVLAPVQVEPSESLTFPDIFNKEPSRQTITIVSPDRADLKLTRSSSSRPDFITAEATPLSPEEIRKMKAVKGGHRVVVEIKPGMPPGRFREELVFHTNHPLREEVKLTVAGTVHGAISVAPERLWMTNVAQGEEQSREAALLVRDGKETRFEVAHVPAPVRVSIAPDDRPGATKGRYRMRVTVPSDAPAGRISDQIVLKTDHPLLPELKVPLMVYVTRHGDRGPGAAPSPAKAGASVNAAARDD